MYTKEFLIDELQRFERRNGRIPKAKDMKKSNGYPSVKAYQRCFTLWSIALNEAGLTINVNDIVFSLKINGVSFIKHVYNEINKKEFEGILPDILVGFVTELPPHTIGRFKEQPLFIMLNYGSYKQYGIDKIIDVLKHEMVHLYLYIKNMPHHDYSPVFINECKKRNIILHLNA